MGFIVGVSVGVAVVGFAVVGIVVGYDVGDSVRNPRNIPILCNVDLSEAVGTGTGAGGSAALANIDAAESTASDFVAD